MKPARTERMASELQKALYEVITKKIKNPLITELVSITRVDVSKDLSFARVFLSIFSTNNEKKQITFNEIRSSVKAIRYELGKEIRARIVPELDFVLDDSMEYSDKMEKLFLKINKDNEQKDSE